MLWRRRDRDRLEERRSEHTHQKFAIGIGVLLLLLLLILLLIVRIARRRRRGGVIFLLLPLLLVFLCQNVLKAC